MTRTRQINTIFGMNYRGTVQGGVIVLEPVIRLPEGQVVELIPLPSPGSNVDDDRLPGFGLWRDRTDLGDTVAPADELRRATSRRSELGGETVAR